MVSDSVGSLKIVFLNLFDIIWTIIGWVF